jgi:hypothetical protein
VIKYRLGCQAGHEFESWFRAIDDYDAQTRSGMIACPTCGSTNISKLPMAPAVVTGRGKQRPVQAARSGGEGDAAPTPGQLRAFKQSIIEHSEDVGRRFADEARKIHFGEAHERNIRGISTPEDARRLIEDEVPFGILPPLPEDLN